MRRPNRHLQMSGRSPEQGSRILIANFLLFLCREIELLKRTECLRKSELRKVRTKQDVVYTYTADRPYEFVSDRRVLEQNGRSRNVEVDVVRIQAFRRASCPYHIPEAKVHAAQMRIDELGSRCCKREIKQFLAVSRDDVEVVHQHDHAQITSTRDDGQHARIRGVELLRVRVQLEYLEAKRGDARDLFDCGFAIIWMDRRNREHLWVLLCKGEMGVVAFSDLVGMPAQSLVWPAEPHATKTYQINSCSFRLRFVLTE